MPEAQRSSDGRIKAVLFDFMGTCLDWHSSIMTALPPDLAPDLQSEFLLNWRQTYFDANTARLRDGKAPEDIDITHRSTLDQILNTQYSEIKPLFTEKVKENAIKAWHFQKAWPDVSDAVRELKAQGLEVYVHANGTTRLQLDIVRSSGLQFDMLFSSELLGVYKPALANYQKVLSLLKLQSDECITVAAHAYDLRGAKAAGMKTVYIRRWTDDILEDQKQVREESDAYVEDMKELGNVVARL